MVLGKHASVGLGRTHGSQAKPCQGSHGQGFGKSLLLKGKDSFWHLITNGPDEKYMMWRAPSWEGWSPGLALLLAKCVTSRWHAPY